MESCQSWIIEHSQVTVVATFGSRQSLEAIVKRDHHCFNSTGQPIANQNWRRAHVVDLDTMKVYSIDGVGLAIEEGRYRQADG